MSADALLLASRALRDLIEADPAVGPEKLAIGPPQATGARLDGPRLGLFLYRVDVAAALRGRERLLPPPRPGEAAGREAGLPLELRYLLTAFGPEDERSASAEQLILLGGALRAVESGALRLGAQPARVTLDPISSEEISRIWSLFPSTGFQTSVALLVTPVWIALAAAPRGAPVVDIGLATAMPRGDAP